MGNHREDNPALALVLTGGGAHAAYEVGFLRCLAKHYPDLKIPILTGVSAGAINAVFLANHSGPFSVAVEDLAKLWEKLTIDQIFKSDSFSLLKNFLHWQVSLISGGLIQAPSGRGLVDSSPLRKMLERQFNPQGEELRGIKDNLEKGTLRAVAISATDYGSDRAITWIQGTEIVGWDRAHRYGLSTEIVIDHIMASSALPLFFPAVYVNGSWFGDGGIRQTSSLAPALHLGASHILAVSTHYEKKQADVPEAFATDHPYPAQILGTLLNSVFLDLILRDARVLERINYLLKKIPEGATSEFREIDLFLLQPSQNISELSGEHWRDMPKMFNYLTKGWGTQRLSSPDWLSVVMFDASYIRRIMDIGKTDAAQQMPEIAKVVEKSGAL
jgi:NTE family protein